jgi:hypothetical protein
MVRDSQSSSVLIAPAQREVERWIEVTLFTGRWLMAPVYVGLLVILGAVAVKFFEEIVLTIPRILSMQERDLQRSQAETPQFDRSDFGDPPASHFSERERAGQAGHCLAARHPSRLRCLGPAAGGHGSSQRIGACKGRNLDYNG